MILERVEVFDGARFIGVHDVAIEGARIAAVEPVPGAATATLLPGFVDLHVHLGFFDPAAVLAGGVTTARDLGWPLDAVRAMVAAGPTLLFAGPMITAPGGYPTRAAWAPPGTGCEVRDEAGARAAVRALVAAGVSVIKVAQEPRAGATLAPEVLAAVVDEAHRHDRRVVSHCGSVAEAHRALDAGVDELAHGVWSDEAVPDALVDAIVARGVTVIPTLHVDPHPARIDATARLVAAGATVLYGTDMGNDPAPGGIDADEIALLVAAGMSLEEALAAATSRAAEAVGRAYAGRIAPGARADVVVVPGDPRDDPALLARPQLVVKDGVTRGGRASSG